ncbi:MAG: hypothetical protein VYE18_06625 [Pseudomonadota bacterium]|nr:hypothetical protein [Pseudomonadota bacterium]
MFKIIVFLVAMFLGQNLGDMAAMSEGGRTKFVEIKERKIIGATTIRVNQGDEVKLIWKTDEKVELHMHGYDIKTSLIPDKPAEMRFIAKATGRFPVTSHGFGDSHGHGHAALIYIEVHPK